MGEAHGLAAPLLDHLADRCHCAYLSDLRFLNEKQQRSLAREVEAVSADAAPLCGVERRAGVSDWPGTGTDSGESQRKNREPPEQMTMAMHQKGVIVSEKPVIEFCRRTEREDLLRQWHLTKESALDA